MCSLFSFVWNLVFIPWNTHAIQNLKRTIKLSVWKKKHSASCSFPLPYIQKLSSKKPHNVSETDCVATVVVRKKQERATTIYQSVTSTCEVYTMLFLNFFPPKTHTRYQDFPKKSFAFVCVVLLCLNFFFWQLNVWEFYERKKKIRPHEKYTNTHYERIGFHTKSKNKRNKMNK